MYDAAIGFLITLVSTALVALVGSHIMLMIKHEKHDNELHRVFDRLKMNRKG